MHRVDQREAGGIDQCLLGVDDKPVFDMRVQDSSEDDQLVFAERQRRFENAFITDGTCRDAA